MAHEQTDDKVDVVLLNRYEAKKHFPSI